MLNLHVASYLAKRNKTKGANFLQPFFDLETGYCGNHWNTKFVTNDLDIKYMKPTITIIGAGISGLSICTHRFYRKKMKLVIEWWPIDEVDGFRLIRVSFYLRPILRQKIIRIMMPCNLKLFKRCFIRWWSVRNCGSV
jgi:hypothetical protein